MNGKVKIKTKLCLDDTLVEISANGYGEKLAEDGYGCPVVVEYYEGKLSVVVWDNINDETPSHIIDLEGAREDKRIEDVSW